VLPERLCERALDAVLPPPVAGAGVPVAALAPPVAGAGVPSIAPGPVPGYQPAGYLVQCAHAQLRREQSRQVVLQRVALGAGGVAAIVGIALAIWRHG
jgi:hypothetical protein